ncbi:MAG: hypothetical protein EZS28_048783, partial [Streblomastix strix]
TEFRQELADFWKDIEEVVAKACHDVMDVKGFLKHDAGGNKGGANAQRPMKINRQSIQGDGQTGSDGSGGQGGQSLEEALMGEMSYTKMAARRQECIRLTAFIRTSDFILLDMLHHIVLQATHDLLMSLRRCQGAPDPNQPQMAEVNKVRDLIRKRKTSEAEEHERARIVKEKRDEEKRRDAEMKEAKKLKQNASLAALVQQQNQAPGQLVKSKSRSQLMKTVQNKQDIGKSNLSQDQNKQELTQQQKKNLSKYDEDYGPDYVQQSTTPRGKMVGGMATMKKKQKDKEMKRLGNQQTGGSTMRDSNNNNNNNDASQFSDNNNNNNNIADDSEQRRDNFIIPYFSPLASEPQPLKRRPALPTKEDSKPVYGGIED